MRANGLTRVRIGWELCGFRGCHPLLTYRRSAGLIGTEFCTIVAYVCAELCTEVAEVCTEFCTGGRGLYRASCTTAAEVTEVCTEWRAPTRGVPPQ